MISRTDEYADCKNEQQFKMRWIARNKGSSKDHYFCIETGSTEPGFPDVLEIVTGEDWNRAYLYEFKFARKGKIKFEPTQPAFFRKNEDLHIKIVAYNPDTRCLHIFPARMILNPDSLYKVDEKAVIDLTWVEHKWMKQ